MSRRDNLVYIQFNGRMMDKRKKCSSSRDVLLGEDASMAQDWICEDAYVEDYIDPDTTIDDEVGATEAIEPRRSARVRELHEVEEFVADEDSENEIALEEEIEFESDNDEMIETNEEEDDDEDTTQP